MAVSGGLNPIYKPGSIVSMKISAAVTAGQVVEVTGDNTVGPAGAASRKGVGVALQSGSAPNDIISVQIFGFIIKLTASGTITAGDDVGTAAAGAVATVAAGTTTDLVRSLVGVALEGTTTGLTFRCLVGKL